MGTEMFLCQAVQTETPIQMQRKLCEPWTQGPCLPCPRPASQRLKATLASGNTPGKEETEVFGKSAGIPSSCPVVTGSTYHPAPVPAIPCPATPLDAAACAKLPRPAAALGMSVGS